MRESKRDTEMMEDNKKKFCDGYPPNKIQQQHFLFFLCTDVIVQMSNVELTV